MNISESMHLPITEKSRESVGCIRKFINVDGRNWQYLETGNPQGLPFVFFHGWFVSDATGVSSYGRALGEQGDYKVIIPEMPGFRGTDKLEKPSLNTMATELHKFIQATTNEEFIVGGVSMGAAVGIELAANYPDKIPALVLHNPITHWSEMNPAIFLLSRSFPQALIHFARISAGVNHITEDIPTLKSMLKSIGSNLAGQLQRVKCPIIVVDGDRDPLALGHKDSHLARNVSHNQYVHHMMRGGHSLIAESPYEVAATVHKSLMNFII